MWCLVPCGAVWAGEVEQRLSGQKYGEGVWPPGLARASNINVLPLERKMWKTFRYSVKEKMEKKTRHAVTGGVAGGGKKSQEGQPP